MDKIDLKRARELSLQVKSFGGTPRKPVKSMYQPVRRSVAKRLPSLSKKKKSRSELLYSIGEPKLEKLNTVIEVPVYYGKPGKDGARGEKGDRGEPGKGKDGYSPVKGVDYFTEDDVEGIATRVLEKIAGERGNTEERNEKEESRELEINLETVKKIVQMMHELPEMDKLEVSKGIRNAQSFIFGKKKYDISELMHGGGSTTTSGQTVVTQYLLTAVQDGSNVTIDLTQLTNWATFSQLITLTRNNIPQTEGVGYNFTITGSDVTVFDADASEIFNITYAYT